MKTIIVIMGKTSSGKDSAARFINEKYGIEPIVSYATRPMREGEVNGREHYFVTDEEMDNIVAGGGLLAFVQFPKTGYRYCSSANSLEDGEIKTYALDPSGLEWMKEHMPKDIKIVSIFFDLSEDIIKERALKRGDRLEDIEKRLDSEREMFDTFKANKGYDVIINTDNTRENVQKEIVKALEQLL